MTMTCHDTITFVSLPAGVDQRVRLETGGNINKRKNRTLAPPPPPLNSPTFLCLAIRFLIMKSWLSR